jgi:hypothetical protein
MAAGARGADLIVAAGLNYEAAGNMALGAQTAANYYCH